LLVLFRRLLAENGIVILGDVVPPHVSAWTDAAALIRFGAANGFLGATLVGLARTLVSDFWRLRFDLGLSRCRDSPAVSPPAHPARCPRPPRTPPIPTPTPRACPSPRARREQRISSRLPVLPRYFEAALPCPLILV